MSVHARRAHRWPRPLPGAEPQIWYGADYNPEQWGREVWDEDIRLMTGAGVNIVSLGIFSWAAIQPGPDEWDFSWLDEIIDALYAAGIAVDLASASASPPPWLTQRHPEVLPVDERGVTIGPGSRIHWRPTSPVFRSYALELCRRLAEHYRGHPAVVAWHVSNEYGWNNRFDFSPDAARAFRDWCRARYGTVDAVNDAWGTSFWSQTLRTFEEIEPPRYSGESGMVNPSALLDFKRFSSDALRDFYRAERDTLAAITPGVPLTTNFMVSYPQAALNYDEWGAEVDFVSNDHYFTAGAGHLDELTFSSALVSGIARKDPWFLMEHSTSAVNWRPVNHRKRPGELRRDALMHVGSGADAVCFFQWRQSRFGAEKFHSAMVPHAGADTRIYRDVTALGADLASLAAVVGSRVDDADIAILFDYESQWASEYGASPTHSTQHWTEAKDWYEALLDLGIRADVQPVAADWERYPAVVLPALYLVSAGTAARLADYVSRGGHVLVSYATGLADERDHIWLGGYPGALRDVVGVRVEEFALLGGDHDGVPTAVTLDNGAVATGWVDVIGETAEGSEVLARYLDDPGARLGGVPAVVRHRYGNGTSLYVGCRLGPDGLVEVLRPVLEAQGLLPEQDQADARLLRVTRSSDTQRFLFTANRTDQPITIAVDGAVLAASDVEVSDVGDKAVLGPAGVIVTAEPAVAAPASGVRPGTTTTRGT